MFALKRALGKAVLVADVDDASVGVAIVRLASHGAASVVFFERKYLTFEERTPEQRAASVVQLLDESVATILATYTKSDEHASPIQEVYAVLRAPWTRYRTAQAIEKYPDARTITKDMIASLTQKALSGSNDFDRTNIIETGVAQVFVNGYATGRPVGKKATRIEVIACEADVQADIRKNIVTTLGKHLPGRAVQFKSGMRALSSVLHAYIPNIERYVVIDMGGSTTSCAVIRKEAISQSSSIAEGRTTIVRRIAGAGLPEEMLTQLRMLSTDTCTTDACKALKDSLARAEPDLTKVFGEAFASLATARRLPNAVMLAAPAELLQWLQGFFARIDFAQFTATMQPFSVETLSGEHLRDAVEWPGGSADTGMTTAAGYVNILGQSS